MASYDGDEGTGRRGSSQHRPSGGGSGDLASSAKLVAEAAKLALQDHSLEKVDKGRVAGAAADLLHAASQYGKLEGKPVDGYLEKAEEYLHQYGRKEGGAGGGKHQGEEEGKYGKKPGGGHGGGRYEDEEEGYKKKPGGGKYEEDEYKKKPGGGSGYGGGRYEEEEDHRKKPGSGGYGGGRYGDEDGYNTKPASGGYGGGRYEQEDEYKRPPSGGGGGYGGGRYEEDEYKKKPSGGGYGGGSMARMKMTRRRRNMVMMSQRAVVLGIT
ncbi:hypothetical protein PVAP13_9KG627900 [Panicum virgatum]|uniref:Uncharacterized protein n=1 Tax=Panicum virgatum TaxID=38727 RepID=A0A8T0NYS1_PANVG|nr:hypothetical protein PVAP13_9KG627900 [Panicum virgatum]